MAKSRRRSVFDRFSRILTSGSFGGIFGLGLAALLLVVIGAIVASLFHIHAGEKDLSVVDAGWEILQRAIDPGQLDGELKWDSRILLFAITAIGILLISTLISIVNSTIERRIEKVRRGRGVVQAENHIVILGWNDLGVKVTEELAEAHGDSGEVEVVVLADYDPVEVVREVQEDLIRRDGNWAKSPLWKRPESWLTVRRGNVTSVGDLENLARLSTAKSVIILGDGHSDAETTKIILAIVASIQTDVVTRTSPVNIVAALDDSVYAQRLKNRIQLLSREWASEGEPIAELLPVTPAMIRTGIEAQVARHRGLSEVYRDLLDFDGDELYLVEPADTSRTFGHFALTQAVLPIGLMHGDDIDLWPDWDTPVGGKSLIVLAPSIHVARRAIDRSVAVALSGARPLGRSTQPAPDSTLIIGWNSLASNLVDSLVATSPRGSTFTVLAHTGDSVEREVVDRYSQVSTIVRVPSVDPLDDRTFVGSFDHVIVLAHEELTASQSDALVLADVLACRVYTEVKDPNRDQPATVVAELRQRVSKNIAGVRLADDLLLSDSLSASAMAHLAVHPQMMPVLSAILESDNPNHVQLMSIESDSVEFVGKRWDFVRQKLAQQHGELAVAVRRNSPRGTVKVNPDSDFKIIMGDEIIVFSRYVPATDTVVNVS